MDNTRPPQIVTRFAPSPSGYLHLGHAYSVLFGHALARQNHGRFLLRIEDIDSGRCRADYIDAIYDDLHWLGVAWETPVLRQSERLELYAAALRRLRDMGLAYPCWARRAQIDRAIAIKTGGSAAWPRDPEGAPIYPQLDKHLSPARQRALRWERRPHVWRLDMAGAYAAACAKAGGALYFSELVAYPDAPRRLAVDASLYGDVIIARDDLPTSYHLSVVIDDAAQNITHITRGLDLLAATHIHRILQVLLDLPEPYYLHHELVRHPDGRRLSKRAGDTSLRALRQGGMSAQAVRDKLPPLDMAGLCFSAKAV